MHGELKFEEKFLLRARSVNHTIHLLNLVNKVKRNNPKRNYCYLCYDAATIKPETLVKIKLKEALNPQSLMPEDLDLPVFGKKYKADSAFSTLMTQISRYSKKRTLRATDHLQKLKGKLQALFIKRYFRCRPTRITNQEIANALLPVVKKMTLSGSIFQELNVLLDDKTKTFNVKFFLKEIVKVVNSKTNDADKCGQGISAWSSALNSIFCVIFRAIESHFKNFLKPHVFFENGSTEFDYESFVKLNFNHDAKKFVCDFKEYDSSQDANTQFLEDCVLDLFIDPSMLLLYREMRLRSKQKSTIASMYTEGTKSSGESATLFTNTIVNMFFIAITTKLDGKIYMELFKGDDSLLNADSIEVVDYINFLDKDLCVQDITVMKADMDYPKYGDFAGYYFSESGLIPDLFKILVKFLSKEHDRKEGYFRELQEALRDKLKFLNHKKLVILNQIYKDIYNFTEYDFNVVYETYMYYVSPKANQYDQLSGGFNGIYWNSSCYPSYELAESEKNAKRVKNPYADRFTDVFRK